MAAHQEPTNFDIGIALDNAGTLTVTIETPGGSFFLSPEQADDIAGDIAGSAATVRSVGPEVQRLIAAGASNATIHAAVNRAIAARARSA